MRDIILVHSAVLLDLLYSVASVYLQHRPVVPMQDFYHAHRTTSEIPSSQGAYSAQNAIEWREKYSDSIEMLVDPVTRTVPDNFMWQSYRGMSKKKYSLSPQFIDWLSFYDWSQFSPIYLGDAVTIPESGNNKKNTGNMSSTLSTVLYPEQNNPPIDEAATPKEGVQCVGLANCQSQIWKKRATRKSVIRKFTSHHLLK
ncbi:unnamed protein product [Spodoptera exigua]|nr:unnamed protein product [Spodoptera exigua]